MSSAGVEVRTLGSSVEEHTLRVEVAPPLPPPAEAPPSWQAPTDRIALPSEDPKSELLEQRPPAYQLPVKKRVYPGFPEQYSWLFGNRKIRCVARAWVDDKGHLVRASVMECPAGMHLLAASALQKWRWEKPDVTVPPGGLEVEAVIGFERGTKGHEAAYFPGVTWLKNPLDVTADPSRPALLRSGDLPAYPAQVNHGDAICEVELTVKKSGHASGILLDGCSLPYRTEAYKAIKGWRFYPAMENGEPVEVTVSTRVVFMLEQQIIETRPH